MKEFGHAVKQWLAENCPESMRTSGTEADWVWGGRNATFSHPDSKDWLQAMGAKGWTCPTCAMT